MTDVRRGYLCRNPHSLRYLLFPELGLFYSFKHWCLEYEQSDEASDGWYDLHSSYQQKFASFELEPREIFDREITIHDKDWRTYLDKA